MNPFVCTRGHPSIASAKEAGTATTPAMRWKYTRQVPMLGNAASYSDHQFPLRISLRDDFENLGIFIAMKTLTIELCKSFESHIDIHLSHQPEDLGEAACCQFLVGNIILLSPVAQGMLRSSRLV